MVTTVVRSSQLATVPRFVLVLSLVMGAGVARAGVNQWTSTGPSAGDVRSLAIDPVNPNTVYVGTSANGVFKSTNAGGTWSAVSDGLTASAPVSALAIDPTNPTIVYAASTGVLKSASGGEKWSPVTSGLPLNVSVLALAMDPSASSTLYAGTTAGLFKTINAGSSWSAIDVDPSVAEVDAVAIDPTNPSTVYVGARGVFKSTNGGASWSSASAGLPAALPAIQVLAIDPSTPSTLYAGTFGNGMYRSTDAGGSWNTITTGAGPVDGVAVHNFIGAFAFDPVTPGLVYVGTGVNGFGGSVFKSTDGGTTWSPHNTGLPNVAIHALVIDPRTRPFYAATGKRRVSRRLFDPATADSVPSYAAVRMPVGLLAPRLRCTQERSAHGRLNWKWTSSAATSKADFGNPLATTDLLLCVYDGTGVMRNPALKTSAVIAAGGTCAGSNVGGSRARGLRT